MKFEFVIWYCIVGEEYWDNNFNCNYSVECFFYMIVDKWCILYFLKVYWVFYKLLCIIMFIFDVVKLLCLCVWNDGFELEKGKRSE